MKVEDFEELNQALNAKIDVIMLDNFSDTDAKTAIALVNKAAGVEISGNVSEENFKSLREIAPDFVSSGALTKHVRAVDLSMRLTREIERK